MTLLELGFSPCPNDTSIFHAMIHGHVDTMGLSFTPHLFDVEALNRKAFRGVLPVTKLSFFAWLKLEDTYELLDSGAASGHGCGPILVGRTPTIKGKTDRIAIPGEYTTAHLLLKLFDPSLKNVEVARFDTIMSGVREGRYDAGVIIHEGRFVYEDYGLSKIVDLGEWWEKETGAPIPLGCIAARKDKNTLALKSHIESVLKASVLYSMKDRTASREYVKKHAQELDDTVIDSHISLYVNPFTVSLGEAGRRAVEKLKEMAVCKKTPLIGIVMATLMEAKPFVAELPLEKTGDSLFPVFLNPEIVLIISGIGKSNAAMAAFHLCQAYSPGVVVNAGAAGAASGGFSLGDIFQINHIVEYDRPDFKTGAPYTYTPDLLDGLKTECAATQDKPVLSPENRERVSMHAKLVDMEAAAVAHAVRKFRIPFFCFKFVTDTPEHHEEENIVKYIKIFRQPFYRFFMTEAMPRLLTDR